MTEWRVEKGILYSNGSGCQPASAAEKYFAERVDELSRDRDSWRDQCTTEATAVEELRRELSSLRQEFRNGLIAARTMLPVMKRVRVTPGDALRVRVIEKIEAWVLSAQKILGEGAEALSESKGGR